MTEIFALFVLVVCCYVFGWLSGYSFRKKEELKKGKQEQLFSIQEGDVKITINRSKV